MNSFVDNLRYGSFRRSGVVFTGLALVIGVGLFFIPELLSVQRSLVPSDPNATTALPAVEATSEDAPLEQVIDIPVERAALSTKRIETTEERPVRRVSSRQVVAERQLKDAPEIEADKPEEEGSLLNSFLSFFGGGQKKVAPTTKQKRNGGSVSASQPQIVSWREIQGETSIREIKSARERVTDLAASYDEKQNPATRYALLNFANALNLVIRPRTAQVMTPNEAVKYLLNHQRAVVESMQKESVDRADIISWSEISLGSVLDQTRAGQGRIDAIPPFNPRLRLTKLVVRHPPNKYGKFKEQNKVYVQFSGVVFGKDVSTIDFIGENGTVQRSLRVGKSEMNGYRGFKSPQLDGREVWTLRVSDRHGETYEKRYGFYPRAQAFPWSSKARGYVLPFNQIEPDSVSFAPGLVDLRIDKFFTLGQPRRADGGEFTLTSGPQDFAVF